MKTISILDKIDRGDSQVLAFDVHDILRLLGSVVMELEWQMIGLECSGENADSLHRLCDGAVRVTGEELMRLTQPRLQTIDGEYQGFRPDAGDPWIVIRAVDSSCFDVECMDPQVLNELAGKFHDVRGREE